MAISVARPVKGVVASDHAVQLRLIGSWGSVPSVVVNGTPVAAVLQAGELIVSLPTGVSTSVARLKVAPLLP